MAGNTSKSIILNDCTTRSFNKSNVGIDSSLSTNASIENETLLSGNSDVSMRQVIKNTSFLKVGCSETSISDLFQKRSLFVMKKKFKLSSSQINDSSASLTSNGQNSSFLSPRKKRNRKVEVSFVPSSQESLVSSSQESNKSTRSKRNKTLQTSSNICDSKSFPICDESLDSTPVDLELTDLENSKNPSIRKDLTERETNGNSDEHCQEIDHSLDSQTTNNLPLNDPSSLTSAKNIVPLSRKKVSIPIHFVLQSSENEKSQNSIESALVDKSATSRKGNMGVAEDSTISKEMMKSLSTTCDTHTEAYIKNNGISTKNVSVSLNLNRCTTLLNTIEEAIKTNKTSLEMEDKTEENSIRISEFDETLTSDFNNQINKNGQKVSMNVEFELTFKDESNTCPNILKYTNSEKEPLNPVKDKNSCDSKNSENDLLLRDSGDNIVCNEDNTTAKSFSNTNVVLCQTESKSEGKNLVAEDLKEPNVLKKCSNNDVSVNKDNNGGEKMNSTYVIEKTDNSASIIIQNTETSGFKKSDLIISENTLVHQSQIKNTSASINISRNINTDEINSDKPNETYTIKSYHDAHSDLKDLSTKKIVDHTLKNETNEVTSDIQNEPEKLQKSKTDKPPIHTVGHSSVISGLSAIKVIDFNVDEQVEGINMVSSDSGNGPKEGNALVSFSSEIQTNERLSRSQDSIHTLAENCQNHYDKSNTSRLYDLEIKIKNNEQEGKVPIVETSKVDLDLKILELENNGTVKEVSALKLSKSDLHVKDLEQNKVSCVENNEESNGVLDIQKLENAVLLNDIEQKKVSCDVKNSLESLPVARDEVHPSIHEKDDHSLHLEVSKDVPIEELLLNSVKDKANELIKERPLGECFRTTQWEEDKKLKSRQDSHLQGYSSSFTESLNNTLPRTAISSTLQFVAEPINPLAENISDGSLNCEPLRADCFEEPVIRPMDSSFRCPESLTNDENIVEMYENTITNSNKNKLHEKLVSNFTSFHNEDKSEPDASSGLSNSLAHASKRSPQKHSKTITSKYNMTKSKRKSVTFASTARMRSDSHSGEITLNSSPNSKSKDNYNGINMSTALSQSVQSDFDLSMTEALSVIKRDDIESQGRRTNCHSTPVKKGIIESDEQSKKQNENHLFLCPEVPLRKSTVSTINNSVVYRKRNNKETEENLEEKIDISNNLVKRKKILDKTINELSYDTLLDVSEIPRDKTIHQKKLIYHSTPINTVLEKKISHINTTDKGRGSLCQHKDQMIQVSKALFGTSSEITSSTSGKKSTDGLSTSYAYSGKLVGSKRNTVSLSSTSKRSRRDENSSVCSSVRGTRSRSASADSINSTSFTSPKSSNGNIASNEESSFRVLRSGNMMSTLTQSTDNTYSPSKVKTIHFRNRLSYVDSTPSMRTRSKTISSQSASDSSLKKDKDIFDITADTPTRYSISQVSESCLDSEPELPNTEYFTPSDHNSIQAPVHKDQSKMSEATLSSKGHLSLKRSFSRVSEYSLNTPEIHLLDNKMMHVPQKGNVLQEAELRRKKTYRHCPESERFLVNGKMYVPPITKFKEKWISPELFKFCTNRLKQNYNLEAPAIAERVISHLCSTVSAVEKLSDYKDVNAQTLVLKNILKKYDICLNMLEYYSLIKKFTPFSFQRKVLPMGGYFGSFKVVSKLKVKDDILTEAEIIQIS